MTEPVEPRAAGQASSTPWQAATIVAVHDETPIAKTFRLRLSQPRRHLAGQHYVVRLTAPDGYTATRSYSVASPPDDSGEVELTVELIPDGEVSGYFHEVAELGDEIELRGPIGRWFVWRADTPAVFIGGGSGVVPLMAMLRTARVQGRSHLARLVVSVRTPEDLYYAEEMTGPEVRVVHTRVAPESSDRAAGRIGPDDLPEVGADTTVFICGSGGFVDHVADLLDAAGVAPEQIRLERFGPT